jgi:hypothetical protein
MMKRVLIFFLRPFVGPIRYGALKVMKKMRPSGDQRPMIATADYALSEIVLPSVFDTFKENEFRELARFKKLPVSEHDRIFNELEVSGVCLAIYYLRFTKPLVRPGDYHFWQGVEEQLPKQLQRKLMGYGVSSSNAKLMKELIDMRYKEYERMADKIWSVNESEGQEFRTLAPEMKRLAAMMQATAVGTTDHIRRGDMAIGDPLISYLAGWLALLQRKIGRLVKKL